MAMTHIAGNVALDFVGTLSERGTTDEEGLVDAAALAAWFVEAGLVDRPPRVTDADLHAARRLRERLYPLVVSLVEQRPLPERSRTAVNRAASRPGPVETLAPDGGRVRRGDAEACLAGVARSAVELFDRTDGATVRFCADERCTHPFLDRSRGKRRRWCDMGTCGDRAKVRRFRAATS